MTASRDFRRELYPFLYRSAQPGDRVAAALDEVRRSTLRKATDVVALREALLEEYHGDLVGTALVAARAFAAGGRLLAFGCGGSATDAQDAVVDLMAPPFADWRPLPAIALTNDVGVVTAVANDVGFENVFARQIIAFGAAGDIALGFTTSGNSSSIVEALKQARRQSMHTIVFTGDDGGAVVQEALADHSFTARTEHIPRIQEGHATLWHTLLDLIQTVLAGRAVEGSGA